MPPEMVPVVSSNILEVGYEVSDQTLFVRFKGDSLYAYSDVPEDIYQGLLAAESVGKYLNQNVKGTYSYRKVS